MISRDLGNTGLTVTVLGFGAMQVGDPRIPEADAGRILNEALDMGIGLIDTARSYGLSEERIGRHISARREDFVLSTKVGYGVEGHPDWTPGCVRQGIDDARTRLNTDTLDAGLEAGVRRFQERHGLAADGVIGPGTLAAMNVPASERLETIRVNLERLRWRAHSSRQACRDQ